MKCPRCGELLVEHLPNMFWRRFFRCEHCESDWSLHRSELYQGKEPNVQHCKVNP